MNQNTRFAVTVALIVTLGGLEMQALLQLREQYSSETWRLVAATEPASGSD